MVFIMLAYTTPQAIKLNSNYSHLKLQQFGILGSHRQDVPLTPVSATSAGDCNVFLSGVSRCGTTPAKLGYKCHPLLRTDMNLAQTS
jgi:hypothetical protein